MANYYYRITPSDKILDKWKLTIEKETESKSSVIHESDEWGNPDAPVSIIKTVIEDDKALDKQISEAKDIEWVKYDG